MKDKGRYDVSDSVEAQFEPNSNDSVLKNKLGIIEPAEMDKVEAEALIKATDALFREYDADHQFCADDICHMHKVWLGDIYEWAGQYRSVNISKDDFPFAMVEQIPKLMTQFETEQLNKYALQAGLPVLDFSLISGSKKSDYFMAVQAGMDRNYEPMEKLFAEIIENSIQALSK